MTRWLELDQKKARLDAMRPLPPHTLTSLRESFALEWTYHSNAIEGNTLTLLETKVVLEGLTVGGKTLREHFEALNHREAILLLEDWVNRREPLSEWSIRSLHQLILKNVDDQNAGRYRLENVLVSGASWTPPDALTVADRMRGLLDWYALEAQTLHPLERAAQLHTRFVCIHPFVDGNGRTARLLLNLELMRSGYPPAIVRLEDRLRYYEVLDLACARGDFSGFTALVGEAVDRSLERYLSLLSP